MEWIRSGDWWVEQETGRTLEHAKLVPAGRWLLDPESGQTIPAPDAEVSPPRPKVTFMWKGEPREIVPPGKGELLFDDAPRPRRLTRWLHEVFMDLEAVPSGEKHGYRAAMEAADEQHVESTVRILIEIQKWCRSEGLFDLSALVVNHKTGAPNSFHFVSDTANEDEWRDYVGRALARIREWEDRI